MFSKRYSKKDQREAYKMENILYLEFLEYPYLLFQSIQNHLLKRVPVQNQLAVKKCNNLDFKFFTCINISSLELSAIFI